MSRRIKKSKKIILYVLFACVCMTLLDFFVKPVYHIKCLVKVMLFFVIPFLIIKKRDRKQLIKMIKPKKGGIFNSIALGFVFYLIILFIYFMLSGKYDFTRIVSLVNVNSGINRDNIINVLIYISIFNSLLEEFFFRGFSFLLLKKNVRKIVSYLFSSLIFALYHISIIVGWFDLPILLCSLGGIMFFGIVFNYLNEKNNNIFNSWMCHLFIDLSVSTVGLIIFGII